MATFLGGITGGKSAILAEVTRGKAAFIGEMTGCYSAFVGGTTGGKAAISPIRSRPSIAIVVKIQCRFRSSVSKCLI